MGKKFTTVLGVFMFIFVLVGCHTHRRAVVGEVPSDHSHRLPNTKVVGDYHLSLSVDHNLGEIALIITDANEKPLEIGEPYINAVLINEAGEKREFKQIKLRSRAQIKSGRLWIKRRNRNMGPYSSVFLYKADWLKLVHDFTLDVRVPIKGKIYTATFSYSIPAKENQHHHHNN